MAQTKIEALKSETWQAVLALELFAKHPAADFGTHFGGSGINYSIEACEIAAKMTGADLIFAKMLNRKFREDACNLMFERALSEVSPAS